MLIAVSGIDGSGKSTQLELVKQHFENKGKTVLYLWTRGGSTPGINAIKAFSRKLGGKKLPPPGNSKKRDEMLGTVWIQRVWLFLAILDLLRIYSISIRWWILRRKVVICDRYIWDTQIDFGIMFPDIKIEDWLLWKILVRLTPVPDNPVLLMIPSKMSADRCAQKYDPFPDTPERRAQRYDFYERASRLEHWNVIDATRSIKSVFREIINDNL
jgi:thymidylate kinase